MLTTFWTLSPRALALPLPAPVRAELLITPPAPAPPPAVAGEPVAVACPEVALPSPQTVIWVPMRMKMLIGFRLSPLISTAAAAWRLTLLDTCAPTALALPLLALAAV